MNRWDIINHFITKYNYKSYLEIGYFKGWSFDNIKCDFKVAVDPNPSKIPVHEEAPHGSVIVEAPHAIYKMTSDEFFASPPIANDFRDHKWDIIFIDGLHEAEQVLRDIGNSIAHLSENGTIIIHDCNPPTWAHVTTGDAGGNWNGDVYKAAVQMRCLAAANFYTIDTDWGVGVLRPNEPPEKIEGEWNFLPWQGDWMQFDQNRKQFLNLISVQEFLEREELHATA